jgi:hypothetical protein
MTRHQPPIRVGRYFPALSSGTGGPAQAVQAGTQDLPPARAYAVDGWPGK